MITLERGRFGALRMVHDDGRDILVDVYYDYPSTASTFGWALTDVQAAGRRLYRNDDARRIPSFAPLPSDPCRHDGTDGTIACPDCGLPALAFIEAAAAWMADHIGATADDPGYFTEA